MFGIDTQQGTVVSSCLLNMHDLVSEMFAFILQMFNEFWQFYFHLLGEGRTRDTNYSLLPHECHYVGQNVS